MKAINLKDHITASYTTLRIGMAGLAVVLPLLLYIGGQLRADLPLQGSMSAYYHAGDGAMRDIFVGMLFAIGFFLMLYKGFTLFENWALNLAGGFLLIVAAVPMAWDCDPACPQWSLHGAAAVLFFLSIAYVCIFRSSDTLGLIADPQRAVVFRKVYRAMGGAMVASPAIAVGLKWFLQPGPGQGTTIFFIEAVGVVIFGIYWFVKSIEIKETHAERDAVEGRLEIETYSLSDIFNPIIVKRIDAVKEAQPQ